ncbi:MAG: 3-dehydroquinate synthase [Armatimonadetes bacterium]|nr:3-dehydroquinate synthase [Armatimonadota bacterium]
MIIKHSRGEYPIWFEPYSDFQAGLQGPFVVITDENVHSAHGHLLPSGIPTLILPPGEATKSIECYSRCLDWLGELPLTRNGTVVALGGGVIGDLVGFVAATYMRGVAFVQVPTTLLAQVDSSIGGKVGIDLPAGKNLAGAFHPPSAVCVSGEFLATLPPRQFVNGTAEVWKAAYIRDESLLTRLRAGALSLDSQDLQQCIISALMIKQQVVEQDEFETTGLRAQLNFGHTIGHAIEKALDYEGLLHGEAVSIGMVVEAQIGEALSITRPGTSEEIKADMIKQGLPITIPESISVDTLLHAMARDKKVTQSGLSFSFLTQIGTCKLCQGLNSVEISRILSDIA